LGLCFYICFFFFKPFLSDEKQQTQQLELVRRDCESTDRTSLKQIFPDLVDEEEGEDDD